MNNYIAKPPKIIELETSSLCNLKCVMCPQSLTGKHGVQRPNHLPELIVEKVIPYLTDDTECISLHGIGEPFLSKSFWKILPLLPAGCHSQCNTNMTVLTDKMLDSIVNSNFNLLNISIDASEAELYEAIRGFDFKKVSNNIRRLVDRKNEVGNTDLKVYCNMTLMKCNIESIVDFMEFFIGDIGVDAVQLWPLNNWGRKANDRYNQGEFNYEYQGLWNHQQLYRRCILEAKEYAEQKDWTLIIDEKL